MGDESGESNGLDKNRKVYCGNSNNGKTVFGYDCRNTRAFSFRQDFSRPHVMW